jgi:gliding motility-associated-like protein
MNLQPKHILLPARLRFSKQYLLKHILWRWLIPLSILGFFTPNLFAQTVLINGTNAICQGDSTILTGVDGYSSYLWSTGATTQSIKVGSANTYSITVTDAQNRTFNDSKTLTVNPLPNPYISGVPYVCNGRSTSLVVEGNYRAVQWSTGERTNTIMANSPATFTATVTDYNACVGNASITVRDGSKPYNTLPDTIKLCQGDSSLLDATTTSAISYYWNTDDTTATLWVSDSGRYNVIVSTGQCVSYDTVRVLLLPPPVVNLGIDTAICKGDTMILRAEKSPLYTYKWSDGSAQPTLEVKNENIYSVEVTFGNCRASDTIEVAIFDKKQGLVLDTVVCTPQYRIDGKLRGAKIYKWNLGSTDSTLVVSKSGVYNLLANNRKCFVNQNFNIRFKKTPVVELGKDSIVCTELSNKSVLLVSGPKDESSYIWQDNSTMNTLQAKASGIYTVVAKNECGETSDAVKIDFKNCYDIFIPSVFSPNDDGVNEKFQLFPSENVAKFNQFSIFDRWGNVVFTASEFNQNEVEKYTWDGRFNGKLLPPDVFVYFVKFTTTDGKILIKKGDVTLMR